MKKNIIIAVIIQIIISLSVQAQNNDNENLISSKAHSALMKNYYASKIYFDNAYQQFPEVPKGMLEAVSYHYTHFVHIDASEQESCTGMPRVCGIMGLTLDGKNYFRNNLLTVATLSGYSPLTIVKNPEINVLAFAKAFSKEKELLNIKSQNPEDLTEVLIALSELNISGEDAVKDYAMNLYLYGILSFLNDPKNQQTYNFPAYKINLTAVFGESNLKVFNSKKVNISTGKVENNSGQIYSPMKMKVACPDYVQPNCSWVASPNHYTGWGGHTISAIAMHTVQGSYTSCINWFQNPSASAATHYVVASNSIYAGQVTQMVDESNAGWHVTTENWYALGYEHEGWVNDPSWYTPLMYQTSADLTIDICNRQNINPLRTFCRDTLDNGTALDSGLHNLGAEGSCIKIKGHQHFPNQTHTDPGPNWNWDHYYKLLNEGTPVTTYTASTGNFYDSGGLVGNYGDDERLCWLIQPVGASSVTIAFSSFNVELNYDFLYIYDGTNEFAPLIGRFNTYSPGTVTASSGAMFIEFRSDCATVGTGWAATWSSNLIDNIPPSTAISTLGNWKTQDFIATFNDSDNVGGTGIEKRFYQVLENNNGLWGANVSQGFFADNFDTLQASVWSVPPACGTWTASGGNLIQSDTAVGNSNIYAELNQELSNRYLYHFTAKVGSGVYSTSQRRFGFHFFCDTANVPNRNNSYFVFFRLETSQLEFYKVANDTFTQVKVVTGITTTANQFYDYKIIYDRITGLIAVYRDDIFLGSWTDPAPYSTGGNYISFRTGNSHLWLGECKVYRTRYPSVTVTVGSGAGNFIRSQNPNPATFGAKIKSICNDYAGNLSAVSYHDLNVDYTAPATVSVINDGVGADIDTISTITDLYANWGTSSDTHSAIQSYWYSIGTTAGDSDFVAWTNNALVTDIHLTALTMTPGNTYFVSVKAQNGAGLLSTMASSDGQYVATAPVASYTANTTTICAGDTVHFTSTSTFVNSYQWQFTGGNPSSSTLQNPDVVYNTAGSYDVKLKVTGFAGSDSLTQTAYITVNPLPLASYIAVDTTVDLAGSGVAYFTNTSSNATSYLWDFGDGGTSTDANPWHLYTAEGDYTVTLIAYSSNCGNDTTVLTNYIHVINTVGITQVSDNFQLTVTPNPFSNQSFVSYFLNEDQYISISLTDILGKQIILNDEKQTAGSHQIKIDAEKQGLSNGMYLLQFRGLNAKTAIKLIIY